MATPSFTLGSLSSIIHMLFDFFKQHPEAAKAAGRVIEQQTAKGRKLDDEAIIMAIMAVIEEHYGTVTGATDKKEASRAKQMLVKAMSTLQPKEQERLRTVIGTIILPEYYKHFVSQTKSDKDAKTGKTKSTTTSWTREAVNQQYTADDLRVKMVCHWAKAIYDGDEATVILEWKVLGATVHSTFFEAFAEKVKGFSGTWEDWITQNQQWFKESAIPKTERGIQRTLGMVLDPKTFKEFLDRYPHDTEEEWEEMLKNFLSNQQVRTCDMHAGNERLRRANTWKATFKGTPFWIIAISAIGFLICIGIWYANL